MTTTTIAPQKEKRTLKSFFPIVELNDELARKDIALRFARVRANVMEIMQRTGLDEIIGSEYFYTSVHDGVDAILAEGLDQPDSSQPEPQEPD